MEFCYDMTLMDRDWEEKILPSIRVYRQEFGDCIIPRAFVVPSSAPWPEKAWGKLLEIVVNEMRRGKAYAEQDKGVLDTLVFAWDRSDAVWNEIVIPALEVYVDTCKNGKVPPQFVVPSEDPWPLGEAPGVATRRFAIQGQIHTYILISICTLRSGRDIEKMDDLGLNVKLSMQAWKERVVPLVSMYVELHREEEVPHDFVIPSESPWEEKMWGVRLGLIVARNPL